MDKSKQWAKDALAGKYQFNTGGSDKKGKRPGFGKKGGISAMQDKRMKGKPPTQGSDGGC